MDTPQAKIENWVIGFKPRGEDIFDFSNLSILKPMDGYYYADPFILKKDGINWLFYELYSYQSNKGRIMCQELKTIESENVIVTRIRDAHMVLDLPHHVSFPSVFEDNGKYYMVPEEGRLGKLQIYECKEWPDKWEVINEVDSGVFGDTAIFKRNGRYALYTTESDDLYSLYTADSLEGKWSLIKKAREPNSRLGGHIFEHEGRLVKPVQNGQKTYGGGIILKDVETDEIMKQIDPNFLPNLTGFHTFNFNEDYIVIDAK